MKRQLDVFLPEATLKLPRFSTGEVAKLLGIPIWRLQKFLDSPTFRLSPSGHLGKGPGSRRTFSARDVYRVGIASFLTQDGFSPTVVSELLQSMEDGDLKNWDKSGEVYPVIYFHRGKKGREIRSGGPPEIKAGGAIYYVLDLGDLISVIDSRIAAADKDRRKE